MLELQPENFNSQKLFKSADGLGKFTKSQAKLENKGFQRSHSFILQDQSAKLLPLERVSNCLKKRIDKNKNRTVMFNESTEKVHWGNMMHCGSLWSCPVCAKQITEQRRSELGQLIKYWENQADSDIKLMTLTFSHSKDEPLKVLLSKLSKAITMFYGSRVFKDLTKLCKVKFKVRSLEVTYGSNGWHPHFHILLLTNDTDDLAYAYRNRLAKLWIRCCEAKGLKSPSMQHGLDIRDGTYANDYISKWGIDYEMTKGHVKRGRKDSFTPFDILQLSIENETIFDKSPSKLWQEFGVAMKGSRQLVWSRGLKKLVGIGEKTDQEIVDDKENESITLRDVDQISFEIVSKYQKRHEFLDWCKSDYINGNLGCGLVEENLVLLFERYIADLPDNESNFYHLCKLTI